VLIFPNEDFGPALGIDSYFIFPGLKPWAIEMFDFALIGASLQTCAPVELSITHRKSAPTFSPPCPRGYSQFDPFGVLNPHGALCAAICLCSFLCDKKNAVFPFPLRW